MHTLTLQDKEKITDYIKNTYSDNNDYIINMIERFFEREKESSLEDWINASGRLFGDIKTFNNKSTGISNAESWQQGWKELSSIFGFDYYEELVQRR